MHSILIIGSDEHSVFLKEKLKSSRYKVYFSSKPKPGLDKARQKRPDLMILNLEGQGSFVIFDMIKEIKSDLKLKDTSIIVLSENDDVLDKTLALELGADDYMVKPANLAEILAKIKCYLKYKAGKPSSRESGRQKSTL